MPNTIAHFAVNGLITRGLITKADLKWIYLACVIPDLPWILQRIIKLLPISIDLYDLRAYCVVQSSLFLCLMLCLALSFLARTKRKVFIILSIGAVLHLLLDAVQIKWANGVHLFLPVNWELLRFDLFWPESVGTYLLTIAGLVYFIFYFKESIDISEKIKIPSTQNILLCLFLITAWLLLPLSMLNQVYQHNNHFISTLKDIEDRTGELIEIDRNKIKVTDSSTQIYTFFAEWITLQNITSRDNQNVSIKGKFINNKTIHVDEYHEHSKFRDFASIFGLFLVIITWVGFFSKVIFKND